MKPSLLEFLQLQTYELDPSHLHFENKRLWVTKWDWDYQHALNFQRDAVRLLQDFPDHQVHILCSHPHVFTLGRGLQRPKKGEVSTLQDFKAEEASQLPFPLFQIERGGGLTFHHPGQVIYYPIVKLNPERLSLSTLMDRIFDSASLVLKNWGLENISSRKDPLGLWCDHHKIASMGIAIERLTTFHGFALNLLRDEKMSQALARLNPCGLNSSVYRSVEELFATMPTSPHQQFAIEFQQRMSHVR